MLVSSYQTSAMRNLLPFTHYLPYLLLSSGSLPVWVCVGLLTR